jgi:hypothetical protein
MIAQMSMGELIAGYIVLALIVGILFGCAARAAGGSADGDA